MKTKTVIFLILAAVLVFGAFRLLKPTNSSDLTITPVETITKIYNIKVEKGKIVSGPNTLTINEGENVVLNFTVDKAEEIHLHGYDKMVELEKGVSGKLSFMANLTGRFTFELENEGIELGVIEVMPKN